MEVLGSEPRITLSVKRLDLLLPVDRNPFPRRLAEPPVQQPRLAFLLVTRLPAPKRPLAHPKQRRCFQLVEFRRLVAAQNVQKPHHTHTLKGFRPAHPTPPSKGAEATGQIARSLNRTYQLLLTRPGAGHPRALRRRPCATTARRGGSDVTRPNRSSLAAQEMRAGPSGPDCRIGVQTTASCPGTMAGVVSVAEKAGKPVRCALVRRMRLNR